MGHVPGSQHVAWATGTALTRNPRFVRELAAVGQGLGQGPVVCCCAAVASARCWRPRPPLPQDFAMCSTCSKASRARSTPSSRGGGDGWRFHNLPWVGLKRGARNPNFADWMNWLDRWKRHGPFDIEQIAQSLSAARREWRDGHNRLKDAGEREFPSRDALAQVVHQLKGARFFPCAWARTTCARRAKTYVAHTLDSAPHALHVQIGWSCATAHASKAWTGRVEAQARQSARRLTVSARHPPPARQRCAGCLPGRPAARSVDEVLLCYPGILAMIHHRLAHRLYQLGLLLLARIVAELAHSETGLIDPPRCADWPRFFSLTTARGW